MNKSAKPLPVPRLVAYVFEVPNDVWFLRPRVAVPMGFFAPISDVWHILRLNGNNRERVKHVCRMPLEVVERIVAVANLEGELVLDPYAGTGTTLVAAARLGRRYLGIELNPGTADLARRRLDEARTLFA